MSKVKSFMEQEKEDLFNLKIELEKTVENLCGKKDKVGNIQMHIFMSTRY